MYDDNTIDKSTSNLDEIGLYDLKRDLYVQFLHVEELTARIIFCIYIYIYIYIVDVMSVLLKKLYIYIYKFVTGYLESLEMKF